jgi:hypothetical protein
MTVVEFRSRRECDDLLRFSKSGKLIDLGPTDLSPRNVVSLIR